ncbi:type VII secretion protein EccE [Mycolicibacterium brumae]|uniref:Type VII secretion protein EccE n=1 Tax=Mycolicibacterium brumae TaxID=85968 RepID=A0A2G5PA99_9MYCO|nr:type VII secretion protein EccE [Mycolicibacterium brumae]MCV7192915.1 type VII secretion protein EccE [Mycolicibacterium brumae]PIB75246.1 type VII secretion protein EccE [Mycolicibacterium brumae]RWA23504.1 hypothetical protein MBRU_01385 [Mycolicibacterium brumae DSM 44177]UWW08566.1 type VII secretion protein EccE [Mycolicibacterium brumae]
MSATARLIAVAIVFATALGGWAVAGFWGAVAGVALGASLTVIPWRGQRPWVWLRLFHRRRHAPPRPEPATLAGDRTGGGVQFTANTAVTAIQVLGRAHRPTLFTGSRSTVTDDTLDVAALLPLLDHPLGLRLESLSVLTIGARRRAAGDYPRVYDTLIGTPPYAGARETWLILRLAALDNADALRWRVSAGVAALAAAQRICGALARGGIRSRVAGATQLAELDHRFGGPVRQRRWRTVAATSGWLTSYGYPPEALTADNLGQAWTLRADGVAQHLTVYPDATMTGTVTVLTNQPPTAPPSVLLTSLPGEQGAALAAAAPGPTVRLRGLRAAAAPPTLPIPVGPSGVLIGRAGAGNRLAFPLTDPGQPTRVWLAAEDVLAKRLLIRAAAAGEQITVHSADTGRWAGLRMPGITVTAQARPAPGTTISVVDGPLDPAPRPATVITIATAGVDADGAHDVTITQTGPATVEIVAAGIRTSAEIELFRVENRLLRADHSVAEQVSPIRDAVRQ